MPKRMQTKKIRHKKADTIFSNRDVKGLPVSARQQKIMLTLRGGQKPYAR